MPVLNVCWMNKHFVEVHVNYYGCAWLRLACAMYLAPRHYVLYYVAGGVL